MPSFASSIALARSQESGAPPPLSNFWRSPESVGEMEHPVVLPFGRSLETVEEHAADTTDAVVTGHRGRS
jgi:hypothetical protein